MTKIKLQKHLNVESCQFLFILILHSEYFLFSQGTWLYTSHCACVRTFVRVSDFDEVHINDEEGR